MATSPQLIVRFLVVGGLVVAPFVDNSNPTARTDDRCEFRWNGMVIANANDQVFLRWRWLCQAWHCDGI